MRAQRSLFVSVSARKVAREIAKPERSRNGSTRASTVLFGNESNLKNDDEITIRNPPPVSFTPRLSCVLLAVGLLPCYRKPAESFVEPPAEATNECSRSCSAAHQRAEEKMATVWDQHQPKTAKIVRSALDCSKVLLSRRQC